MRLYIPNKSQEENRDEEIEEKKSKSSPKSDLSENDKEGETKNTMAETIKEDIMKYANIGSLGDSIAHIPEISMLTPRGKFDMYMLKNALKIHGPSHDYKISYKNIARAFLLPKPDGVHLAFVVALNNPIRQGKTVYPFLVFQFKDKAPHKPVTLNLPEDEQERKALFKYDIVEPTMTGEVYDNMAKLFKSLIGIAVVIPSKSFRSFRGATSVKCSVKANEGYLYFLEKCLLFIHKPVVYISLEDVKYVECSRVNDSNLQQRTFDFSVFCKKEEIQFVGIEKNELEPITNYFNIKKIRIKSAEGGEIKTSVIILFI
jgi:structure-specific recognition protein 1